MKRPARVLLVEDHPMVVRDLSKRLDELGYQLTGTASSAEEALRLADLHLPDLVLMDIGLEGEMDGIEVARLIRDRLRLPLVFITASTDPNVLERAKTAEPQGYIVKPCSSQDLRVVIEVALCKQEAELRLRVQSEQLRTILQTTMDGFWLLNLQGTILDVNQAACLLLGYSRAEMLHLAADDLDAGPNPVPFAACIEQVVRSGSARFERRQKAKDGRVLEVEVSADFHPNEGGRLFCFLRDVTERRAAETALRHSEASLAAAQRVAHIGSWELELAVESGPKRLQWSAEAYRIFGYPQGGLEVTSENFFQAVHPDDRDLIRRTLSEAISGRVPYEVEHRILRPNGEERIVRERGEIVCSEQGVPEKIIGTVQDITENKRSEEVLLETSNLLRILLANLDAGTLVEDEQRRIMHVNQRFCNLFGLPHAPDELLGRGFDQAVGPCKVLFAAPEDFSRGVSRLLNQRIPVNNEELLLQDGRVFSRDYTPIVLGPDRSGHLWTYRDITEKTRLEQQILRAQRLESVGTLASGVAHDLNNVLSPILMGLDMLKTSLTSAEDLSMLAMMQESAVRGKETVHQLLTFARGAASQKGPVQLRHLLKEVVRLLQQTFPKDIQIHSHYSEEPFVVNADPSQLHQVLMNLCVNARDAMPQGGLLTLSLENQVLGEEAPRLHLQARPGCYTVLKVIDTGSGIQPEILDRIFDPFFTTKPQGKGTGLGLATALGIVESHGGVILVQTQVGRGTTFIMYLPATASQVEPLSAAPAPRLVNGTGELILVVDDEHSILRVARTLLGNSGYRCLTAANAHRALELFTTHRKDICLVLTDVMMPFGDGRQLISSLHQLAPELPLIAMSGLASADISTELQSLGARTFLVKPFGASELLKAIHLCLKPGRPV